MTEVLDKPTLNPRHAQQLDASAISEEIRAERGYRTVETRAELARVDGQLADYQQLAPGMAIPVYRLGKPYTVVLKPDSPRTKKDEPDKPVKYEYPAGVPYCLDMLPRFKEWLTDPNVPLWFTEGAKKADSIASLGAAIVPINVGGVWCWQKKDGSGEHQPIADFSNIPLQGRSVVLLFDSDAWVKFQVWDALDKFAKALRKAGAKVSYCLLPHTEGGKTGADDYLRSGKTYSDLKALISSKLPPKPRTESARPELAKDGRAEIDVTHQDDLGRISAETWAAVLASPFANELYRYGSELASFNGRNLTPVDLDLWRGMVCRAASFVRKEANGQATGVIPPKPMLADSLLARFIPNDTLRPVNRVSPLPIFSPSGALLTNGYHAADRILVTSDIDPAPLDQADALKLVHDELFVDFPFASRADRANALAYLLLPFVREMCGPLPLFLIDAAQRGTGKTLFNDLVHIIWTGTAAPLSDLPLNAEEQRKAITSHLMSGPLSVVFDDVSLLQGHALQRAVTGEEWADRLLGTNKNINVPIRTVWAATGNNVSLSGDMVRRVIRVRLESTEERPSQRTGFKRGESDLKQWTHDNRAQLVSACTSLVTYGLAHGTAGGVVLGGFDRFAQLMTRILNGLGVVGFCENLEDVYTQEDGRQSGWKAIVWEWWQQFGATPVKAGQIATLIEDDKDCEIIIDGDTLKAQAIAAGKLLKTRIGAVFAFETVRLQLRTVKNSKGDTLYTLTEIEQKAENSASQSPSGSSGSSGSPQPVNLPDTNCSDHTVLEPIPSEPATSATSATSAMASESQIAPVVPAAKLDATFYQSAREAAQDGRTKDATRYLGLIRDAATRRAAIAEVERIVAAAQEVAS